MLIFSLSLLCANRFLFHVFLEKKRVIYFVCDAFCDESLTYHTYLQHFQMCWEELITHVRLALSGIALSRELRRNLIDYSTQNFQRRKMLKTSNEKKTRWSITQLRLKKNLLIMQWSHSHRMVFRLSLDQNDLIHSWNFFSHSLGSFMNKILKTQKKRFCVEWITILRNAYAKVFKSLDCVCLFAWSTWDFSLFFFRAVKITHCC